MTVVLSGNGLAVADVVRVARDAEPVELAPEAVERMRETRALVDRVVERGDEVYGTTTGRSIASPSRRSRRSTAD